MDVDTAIATDVKFDVNIVVGVGVDDTDGTRQSRCYVLLAKHFLPHFLYPGVQLN